MYSDTKRQVYVFLDLGWVENMYVIRADLSKYPLKTIPTLLNYCKHNQNLSIAADKRQYEREENKGQRPQKIGKHF